MSGCLSANCGSSWSSCTTRYYFWKVISIDIAYGELKSELTFQHVCIRRTASCSVSTCSLRSCAASGCVSVSVSVWVSICLSVFLCICVCVCHCLCMRRSASCSTLTYSLRACAAAGCVRTSVFVCLRLVGSLKSYVSFVEYRLFYRALLQKRPITLRSLLIVATP